MKIYQLHEYSGEYEDFSDRIIGSYLRKERAEEEKAKAELNEKDLMEHRHRCNYCPFLENTDLNLDVLLVMYSDYCSEMELEKSEYGIDCENYYSKWDESTFEIIEVEVEE